MRGNGIVKGLLSIGGVVLFELELFELLDHLIVSGCIDIAFFPENLDHFSHVFIGAAHFQGEEFVHIVDGCEFFEFLESLGLVLLHGLVGVGHVRGD